MNASVCDDGNMTKSVNFINENVQRLSFYSPSCLRKKSNIKLIESNLKIDFHAVLTLFRFKHDTDGSLIITGLIWSLSETEVHFYSDEWQNTVRIAAKDKNTHNRIFTKKEKYREIDDESTVIPQLLCL